MVDDEEDFLRHTHSVNYDLVQYDTKPMLHIFSIIFNELILKLAVHASWRSDSMQDSVHCIV